MYDPMRVFQDPKFEWDLTHNPTKNKGYRDFVLSPYCQGNNALKMTIPVDGWRLFKPQDTKKGLTIPANSKFLNLNSYRNKNE